MLLYVDDILTAGKSKFAIDETKAMLKSEFEMKDSCAAKRLSGMDIRRDRSEGKLGLSLEVSMLRSKFSIGSTCHKRRLFLPHW